MHRERRDERGMDSCSGPRTMAPIGKKGRMGRGWQEPKGSTEGRVEPGGSVRPSGRCTNTVHDPQSPKCWEENQNGCFTMLGVDSARAPRHVTVHGKEAIAPRIVRRRSNNSYSIHGRERIPKSRAMHFQDDKNDGGLPKRVPSFPNATMGCEGFHDVDRRISRFRKVNPNRLLPCKNSDSTIVAQRCLLPQENCALGVALDVR